MLTTLVTKHLVGSLTDDVFYRNLRLDKTKLKYTCLAKLILILAELTMFLEALAFPLSPAASSIFCLWRSTHF